MNCGKETSEIPEISLSVSRDILRLVKLYKKKYYRESDLNYF